jgi:hypothetical protein
LALEADFYALLTAAFAAFLAALTLLASLATFWLNLAAVALAA